MFWVKDIKQYSLARQRALDERRLGETKTAIRRTSSIRDDLGALVPAKADDLLQASPIMRKKLHLHSENSRHGMEADPRRQPLQKAQFQILVEAARNVWLSCGKEAEAEKISHWVRDLSYVDAALHATRPLKKGEVTYEDWWRKAVRALPKDQYRAVQDGLAEMQGYFATHTSLRVHEVLNRSASILMGQFSSALDPTLEERKGSYLVLMLRHGFGVLGELGLPVSLVGKVGMKLLPKLKEEDVEPAGPEL